MLFRKFSIVFGLVVSLAVTSVLYAQNYLPDPPTGLEGNRDQVTNTLLNCKNEPLLIAAIKMEGDDEHHRYVKMLASKRLSVYGTKECISALIPMLAHQDMGMYARYAMEPIPDPAVDQAFRDALKTLKGGPLVGVLTSIGVRKDAEAVPQLAEILKNDDPEVVRAAYGAYGYIGNADCAAALKEALKKITPEYQKAICDAAFDCAEALYATDKAGSLALYDAVLASDAAAFLKEAAIYRRILALGPDGKADLFKYLNSEDKALFDSALKTVREIEDSADFKVAESVVSQLDDLSPERRGLVIEAIADRKDDASKNVAFAVASTLKEPEVVRVSAMNALGKIDGTRVIPFLMTAASEDDGKSAVAKAAFHSLVFITGEGVDEAITEQLSKGSVKLDKTMIELARERRIASATPLLKKEIDGNTSLKTDAIRALGETATLKDVIWIAELLPKAQNEDAKKTVRNALNGVVIRMPESEAVKNVLDTANKTKSKEVKLAMVEMLKTIGNTEAIKATTSMALGNDSELQDEATKILGQWAPGTDDINEELIASILKLANDDKLARFKDRLLSAYIRIPRQFGSISETKRIEMINTGFKLATRPERKKTIFEIFSRYPSAKMLDVAMEYTKNAAYAEDACTAAVATAEKLQGKSGMTIIAMEKVLEITKNNDLKLRANTVISKNEGASDKAALDRLRKILADEADLKIELLSAQYGANDKFADVLPKIKAKFNGSRFVPIQAYNAEFGDPINGVVKTLNIKYKINDGPEKSVTFKENETIILPK